jgi:hypothetical protein
MTTLRGRVGGHHDLVAEAGRDLVVAPRAAIGLHRLVGLDVTDLEWPVGNFGAVHAGPNQPNTAQRTSAAITTSATATITMSLLRFAWERNGFRPIPLR